MEATTANNDLGDRWYKMLFGLRRSIRYHQRRRAFFDRLDQFATLLSVVFGSAAFYGILKGESSETLALLASAMVTVFASINLVVGSARRAREHADFARRFVDLEKRMIGSESEDRFSEVAEARLSIEAEEPPVLRVLDCLCHNEQLRSMGHEREDHVKIGPLQRLFAHFFDFRESAIH